MALNGDIATFESYLKSREIVYPAVEWRITLTTKEEEGEGGARAINVSIVLIILSVFLNYIK